MRQSIRWSFVLLLCLMLTACATVDVKVPTDAEKLTEMYAIYNAQHEDYVSMSKMTNLTEGQKAVMRIKKPILEKLQVLLPIYDSSVVAGTPNRTQEQQIYDMLNELQAAVVN